MISYLKATPTLTGTGGIAAETHTLIPMFSKAHNQWLAASLALVAAVIVSSGLFAAACCLAGLIIGLALAEALIMLAARTGHVQTGKLEPALLLQATGLKVSADLMLRATLLSLIQSGRYVLSGEGPKLVMTPGNSQEPPEACASVVASHLDLWTEDGAVGLNEAIHRLEAANRLAIPHLLKAAEHELRAAGNRKVLMIRNSIALLLLVAGLTVAFFLSEIGWLAVGVSWGMIWAPAISLVNVGRPGKEEYYHLISGDKFVPPPLSYQPWSDLLVDSLALGCGFRMAEQCQSSLELLGATRKDDDIVRLRMLCKATAELASDSKQ